MSLVKMSNMRSDSSAPTLSGGSARHDSIPSHSSLHSAERRFSHNCNCKGDSRTCPEVPKGRLHRGKGSEGIARSVLPRDVVANADGTMLTSTGWTSPLRTASHRKSATLVVALPVNTTCDHWLCSSNWYWPSNMHVASGVLMFGQAALLIYNPDIFDEDFSEQDHQSLDECLFTEYDRMALDNEPKLGFWDQPWPFRTTCYMLFAAAITQGWNQTATNGRYCIVLSGRYLIVVVD